MLGIVDAEMQMAGKSLSLRSTTRGGDASVCAGPIGGPSR